MLVYSDIIHKNNQKRAGEMAQWENNLSRKLNDLS